MNEIINIEDIRNIEAGNGIERIDYAYDGYDYEAEKDKLVKL